MNRMIPAVSSAPLLAGLSIPNIAKPTEETNTNNNNGWSKGQGKYGDKWLYLGQDKHQNMMHLKWVWPRT